MRQRAARGRLPAESDFRSPRAGLRVAAAARRGPRGPGGHGRYLRWRGWGRLRLRAGRPGPADALGRPGRLEPGAAGPDRMAAPVQAPERGLSHIGGADDSWQAILFSLRRFRAAVTWPEGSTGLGTVDAEKARVIHPLHPERPRVPEHGVLERMFQRPMSVLDRRIP